MDERLFDTEIYSPEMHEKVGRYRELAALPKAARGIAETRRSAAWPWRSGNGRSPITGERDGPSAQASYRKHNL